jgi:nucleoside phosphorylase
MKPILIQGAHLPELQKLLDSFPGGCIEEVVQGFKFYVGNMRIQGREYPVVLSLTGIGMALAAASVLAAKHHYDPLVIINQGIAGGHTRDVHVGDIVIGEFCINMNTFKTPFAPSGSGSNSLTWKPKKSRGNGGGHEGIGASEDLSYIDRKRLPGDANMLQVCKDMSESGEHKVNHLEK